MAPQTLTQQRQTAVEAGTRAEAELADLQAQRQRLAFDALRTKAGTAGATKALADLDARIVELVRTQELARLATLEADRREAEAAERQALAERIRLEAEHAELSRRRDERYPRIQTLTAHLAGEVKAALALGDQIHDARVRAGMPFVPGRTSARLFNYLSARLGTLGAGIRAFPTPLPMSRGPLVEDGGEHA